jgi:hypothetical protein
MNDLEALRAILSGPGSDLATGDRGGRGDEVYTAIPSGGSPRLLVPRGARRVATAAIKHVIAPSSAKARLRQAALVGMFASGVGDLVFRDHLRISGDDTLAAHLGDAVGQPVRVSVRFGPPRANRKPVLQLLDRRGHAVGFAKLGVNDLTKALVTAETAALRQIAGRDLGVVRAPGVLHAGAWNGMELLVIEALPVWAARGSKAGNAAAAIEAMRAVAGTPTPLPLADSPYLSGLADRVAALPDAPAAAVLADAVAHAHTGSASLPFGAWHGDWNGGNMAVRADGVLLWDWERYAVGVPLGFDLLHYELHEEVTVRGTDPAPASAALAQRCADLLAPFGVDAAQARAIMALYLIEIASRYIGDGQSQTDAPRLGRASEWIGPALAAVGDWWTSLQEVATHGA